MIKVSGIAIAETKQRQRCYPEQTFLSRVERQRSENTALEASKHIENGVAAFFISQKRDRGSVNRAPRSSTFCTVRRTNLPYRMPTLAWSRFLTKV
jgi:hypothetical protein